MKVQNIKQFGDADVFQSETQDVPTPSNNQVLIKVYATSVNPIDTKIRSGILGGDLPMILHSDFSGEVVALGVDVQGFQIGDMVYGKCGQWGGGTGTLAEYALSDYRLMAHAPKNIDIRDCAVLPLVSLTAMLGLERLNVCKKDTVCIQSATGGVGYMATQIALARGAKVVGITSDASKVEMLTNLGAEVINRTTQDQVSIAKTYGGFDKIFNTVGTESLDDAFEMAGAFGHIVGIAGRSTHNLALLHGKSLSLSFVFLKATIENPDTSAQIGDMLRALTQMVEQGDVKPLIHEQRFTLDTISDAHRFLEMGYHQGKKIVIDIV